MDIKNKYYLIGAVSLADNIFEINNSIQRKNLVDIPAIMKYKLDIENNNKYFINSMSQCVIIREYFEFESFNEMQKDWNEAGEKYKTAYKEMVKCLNDKSELNIEDLEWVMVFYYNPDLDKESDVWDVSSSFIGTSKDIFTNIINHNEDMSYLTKLIDPAMIYQSTMEIGKFFKNLSMYAEIDKYNGYKISFFIQELKSLEKPTYFLTNQKEIEVMSGFYDEWSLTEQIKTAIDIARQSIEVFDFVTKNNQSTKADYSTAFMGYLSFVLVIEPVIDLILRLFPQISGYNEFILQIAIILSTVFFLLKIYKKFKYIKNKSQEFIKKTKKI